MRRTLSAALLFSAALITSWAAPAAAADITDGGRWFSGVASSDGNGLILPTQISIASRWYGGEDFDSDFAGTYWVGGSIEVDDASDQGAASPMLRDSGAPVALMANGFVALTDGLWGVTPYVGAGVGSTPAMPGMFFSGMASLLPESGATSPAYQGIAGISFQFTEYLGAGLEYRYLATDEALGLTGAPERDQDYQSHTIMLRLDLGLN